ncbi:uncharacterized protein LTR77_008632 [Saxophila tyrrhenica]|uniref:Major facilitator superfamily (MFS) profile domain-containing protein n=1 Tax=Saxophila tyrrhenica TaxID=1690608 RepID=A0AAV9P3P1_9PEZI|nr:hypothetical protein LTR77_008632 [Saxophila tyrrhenica]
MSSHRQHYGEEGRMSARQVEEQKPAMAMLNVQHVTYTSPSIQESQDELLYAEADESSMNFRRAMVLVAMGFLWTSSQMPLYFYGGIQINVLQSIGGYAQFVWLGLSGLIPLAIVTPFVGALSDLFGRRNIGLTAFALIIFGNIMCATAQHMNVFLAGTILIAVGAGIGELVALAVTADIAPPKHRGLYVGAVVSTVLPFCPSTLYAQLIAHASTWRWVGLLIGGWSFVGTVLLAVFYWPPPTKTLHTRRELFLRIDWTGGFLSTAAICLILVGLSLPTSGYKWSDHRTLVSLILGIFSAFAFAIWEWRFARYPMLPARLKEKNPRVLTIVLLIMFVSGANYFAVLAYWPNQYQNVYADGSPTSAGIGSLPVMLGIISGSIVVTALVSILKGRIRMLLVVSSIVMVAFNGAMAAGTKDNLPAMWAILCVACLGVGATLVPTQVIAGIICPDDLLATITAITITVRILGGCLAYAVYTNIFASKFASEAATKIVPTLLSYGITDAQEMSRIVEVIRGGGFQLLADYPGIETQARVAEITAAGKEALLHSYPVVYYASVGFGAIAIIASFFLTGIEDQMTGDAAVKIG